MSLTGRSTCASASALSLDAQPAQVERVVRRISRPVCGIGINLLNQNDQQPVFLVTGRFLNEMTVNMFLHQGVVEGVVVVVAGVSAEPGSGRIN